MAFNSGKTGYFAVDDGGGTLRDISAYVTSVDFPQEQGAYETSVFGTTAKTYVPGMTDGTFSVNGFFDPVVDGYLFGNVGKATTSTFSYGPNGNPASATKPVYGGEAILSNYTVNEIADGLASWSCTFQCSGAISRAVA